MTNDRFIDIYSNTPNAHLYLNELDKRNLWEIGKDTTAKGLACTE